MYASVKLGLIPEQTSNPYTFGEPMKKILFALLLGFAGVASAATPTNTITPSVTPTLTSTLTITPTPTRTNTPVMSFAAGQSRVFVQSIDFRQTDGVSSPLTYAAAGGTDIWLAQTLSFTGAVFGTGTAAARWQLVVPGDYMRNAGLWVYGINSTLTNTVQVQCNVAKVSMNTLTSTASVYLGVTTNVQTQFVGPLLGGRLSRVWIPLSGTVKNYGVLKPGDTLNFDFQRFGSSGNFTVLQAEFSYDCNFPLRP